VQCHGGRESTDSGSDHHCMMLRHGTPASVRFEHAHDTPRRGLHITHRDHGGSSGITPPYHPR
jgi:hypothetical protein